MKKIFNWSNLYMFVLIIGIITFPISAYGNLRSGRPWVAAMDGLLTLIYIAWIKEELSKRKQRKVLH